MLVLMMSLFSQTSKSEGYNITNFRGKQATTEEFIKALKPSPNQATQDPGGLEFRSLGIGGAKKPLPDVSNKAASVELVFELNSYQLTDKAKDLLGQLGPALQNQELSNYKFLVEGHTDSRGLDEYNMGLSKNRALAVKQYLIYNFGINSNRLTAVGRGERNLLYPGNPEHPSNRRVQIVNIQ